MLGSAFLRPSLRKCLGSSRQTCANRFSSYQSSGTTRAYPQYSVFGEDCLLSFKVMPPQFKMLRNNSLVIDGNKKGRILLEWTPRQADGSISRDSQIRFALSPEEIGLVLDQLPHNQIELSRRGVSADGRPDASNTSPNKVLRISPSLGGAMTYSVDFELNGVGGQTPDSNEASGPLQVTAQLGEQKVAEELLRTSIPFLTGWVTQLEISMQNAVEEAESTGGGISGVPF